MKRRALLSIVTVTVTVAAVAAAVTRQRLRAAHALGLEPGLERRLQRRRPTACPRRPTGSSTPAPAIRAGPPNWGTGEIQTYTNSASNVSLDGSGNLRITPIRNGSGQWTSARVETTRSNFKAPSGGVLRIEGRVQMPNVTGAQAAGYWPAFWALGAPFRGNYWNWPGIGEFDIMENVNGINSVWARSPLWSRAGRAVQRVQRPRREPRLPRLVVPVGVPHLSLRVGRQREPATTALVRRRPARTTPSPSRRSASRTGPT